MALSHSPSIVTDGLVLCLDAGNQRSYPGSGTTWRDLSGNGNHGTLVNGVGYDSANGGSLVFDGVDDYINIGNIGNYSILSYTLECFIYPQFDSSVYGRNFFAKSLSCNTGELAFQYGRITNKFSFLSSFSSVALTSTLTYPKNNWYHAVITRTNNGNGTYTNRLYINCILDNITIVSHNSETTNGILIIGSQKSCSLVANFLGKIRISRIYTRALSASEVFQNYNATKGRFGL